MTSPAYVANRPCCASGGNPDQQRPSARKTVSTAKKKPRQPVRGWSLGDRHLKERVTSGSKSYMEGEIENLEGYLLIASAVGLADYVQNPEAFQAR